MVEGREMASKSRKEEESNRERLRIGMSEMEWWSGVHWSRVAMSEYLFLSLPLSGSP